MSSNPKSRSVCFTLNNYGPADLASLVLLALEPSVKYLLYGREVGESGTPHLQGFLYLHNPRVFSYFTGALPRSHIEFTRGAVDQAIAYCKKDGLFDEFGTAPLTPAAKGVAEAQRWESARTAAKEGDLDSVPADIFVRYYRTLKEISKDFMRKPPDLDSGPCGLWMYGPAGVGKSRKAREDFPDSYFKMCNKWWDGYQGEATVIIDDLDKKHDVLGHHLKIWADRYAFIAENKGGALLIRPSKIVVTSQYSINEIWEDAETREALHRRYTVVHLNDFFVR